MNPDELSLTENESLEIIGAGDGDGWLLVCTGILHCITFYLFIRGFNYFRNYLIFYNSYCTASRANLLAAKEIN